jgi:hypothetical protein
MFETIQRPTNTGNPLYDYERCLPPSAPVGKLYQVEDSNVMVEPYSGKGKMLGIHIYKPWYFEGKINHHQKISLQPNGKIKRYSAFYHISGFNYD